MDKGILKQYDYFAEDFSIIHENENRVSIKNLYSKIDFSLKNKKILDLGCGDGFDLNYYNKLGAKPYGIDSSKEMINLAQKKNPKFTLTEGNFEKKLPFKNNFFDVVVSRYAIQTCRNILPIYKEVYRILKKEGIFLFLVVHPFRQFIEKEKITKNYFKKEIVKSKIFNNKLIINEPSHTMKEYFSSFMLKHFEIINYDELYDPAAEKINNDTYPGFMVIKSKKKSV